MNTPAKNTPKALTKRKKLGELLLQAKLIDQKILDKALEIQKSQKKRIGQVLLDMGIINDEMIAKALASQLKIPFLRLGNIQIPKEVTDLVPPVSYTHLTLPTKRIV